MPDKQQQDDGTPSPQSEGTPVVIPHIDFTVPTGNPQVEVRKGYGLTPPATSSSSAQPEETPDA
jgi:hypothetical protein